MNISAPVFTLTLIAHSLTQATEPLSSWNDTAPKKEIISFVEKVTKKESPDFVPIPERIATFDHDGCLWAEQPMYFQAFFIFDRIRQLAPLHPEWKDQEPFASVLKGDMKSALAGGEHALIEMAMATHAGMTTEEFEQLVSDWITTAKHPTTGRPLTEMVYEPMREVLDYLRENGFKTYIVSGGGIEFMRPWSLQKKSGKWRLHDAAQSNYYAPGDHMGFRDINASQLAGELADRVKLTDAERKQVAGFKA